MFKRNTHMLQQPNQTQSLAAYSEAYPTIMRADAHSVGKAQTPPMRHGVRRT